MPSTASSSDIGGAHTVPPTPNWPERDLFWPVATDGPDDPSVEDVFGVFTESTPPAWPAASPGFVPHVERDATDFGQPDPAERTATDRGPGEFGFPAPEPSTPARPPALPPSIGNAGGTTGRGGEAPPRPAPERAVGGPPHASPHPTHDPTDQHRDPDVPAVRIDSSSEQEGSTQAPAPPSAAAPAPRESADRSGPAAGRFAESLPLPGPALVVRRDDPTRDPQSTGRAAHDPAALPADPLFRHAQPAEIRLGMRALVIGLMTLVLVIALGIAFVTGRGSSTEAVAPATSSAFPGSPPDGLSAPDWATPPLDPRAESPVVDEGRALAYVTADHHIATSGVDGTLRWSADLPSGPVERGPVLTSVGEAAALVTQVGGRLIAHAVSDGRIIVDTPMPQGATVSFAGAAPLVVFDPRTAGVLTASGLSRVTVPAGLRPLSAASTGTVFAASAQGWCDLHPDAAAPTLTPWEHLPGTDPRATPVATIGTSVLLLTPGNHPWLEVQQRASGMKPLFRAPLEPATGSAGMTWAPAPNRSWGILGSNLVDLQAGRVVGLGSWGTTLTITDSHAYGDDGSTVRITGPDRATEPVRVRSALVESDAVSGVFTRSKVGDEVRVWFIDTAHRD